MLFSNDECNLCFDPKEKYASEYHVPLSEYTIHAFHIAQQGC